MEFFRYQALGIIKALGLSYGITDAQKEQLTKFMNDGNSFRAQ